MPPADRQTHATNCAALRVKELRLLRRDVTLYFPAPTAHRHRALTTPCADLELINPEQAFVWWHISEMAKPLGWRYAAIKYARRYRTAVVLHETGLVSAFTTLCDLTFAPENGVFIGGNNSVPLARCFQNAMRYHRVSLIL